MAKTRATQLFSQFLAPLISFQFLNFRASLRPQSRSDVSFFSLLSVSLVCLQVRKNYRRIALLVHPDKNRHEKAEDAFKVLDSVLSWVCGDRFASIEGPLGSIRLSPRRFTPEALSQRGSASFTLHTPPCMLPAPATASDIINQASGLRGQKSDSRNPRQSIWQCTSNQAIKQATGHRLRISQSGILQTGGTHHAPYTIRHASNFMQQQPNLHPWLAMPSVLSLQPSFTIPIIATVAPRRKTTHAPS